MINRCAIYFQKRVSEAIIIVLIFVLNSGCVLKSKYLELEENSATERAKFQEEIAGLKSQKASQESELTAEKIKLQSEIAALQSQKADIEGKKESLDREMAELTEKIAQMGLQTEAIKKEKDEEINRLKGTYDNLVRDLKGEIEKGEIKVTQIRNRLSVNLVEKVLFDSGHAQIKAKGKEILKRVGDILSNVKDKEIRIEGYTDNIPIGESLRNQFPTNWELSTQRATNVLRFLQEDAAVDGNRLSAVGYGPFHPVANNDTPQGRAQNRRIEIVLAPLDVQEVLKDLK
jgi:chemotaxis protein MotB